MKKLHRINICRNNHYPVKAVKPFVIDHIGGTIQSSCKRTFLVTDKFMFSTLKKPTEDSERKN